MRNLAIKALSFSALTIFFCVYAYVFMEALKHGYEFWCESEVIAGAACFIFAGIQLAVLAHIIEDKMK